MSDTIRFHNPGWLLGLGLFMTVVFFVCPTQAAQVRGPEAATWESALPVDQVPQILLAQVDRAETAKEDDERLRDGDPYRFALPEDVALTPDNSGLWEMLPGTDRLWRLRLECPDAMSMNLGFSQYYLPPRAQLSVFAADGSGPVLVFDAQDNRTHGELWTPILLTDAVVVQLWLPEGAGDRWQVELETVGKGYRMFGEESDKSGLCNVDVVCSEGDPWRDEIATVGVYTINGIWSCTGALINNTSQDERPLFLTANHCDVSQVNDSSVVIYWNFQSPTCGQHGGGSLDQFSSGTTLLANYSGTDFALLELEDNPDPVFGVNFAGWDRSAVVPASAVAIHHPSTDEKSISFEDDPLLVTSYRDETGPGDGSHLKINDWDMGTTEPGSSGSPLFNSDKLIVGQLHGGWAACGNDLPDWYGWLNQSWDGGGTAATRLSDWLDPDGLGSLTLALLPGGSGPIDPPSENANLRILNTAPNPFLDYMVVTVALDTPVQPEAKIYNIAGHMVADLGQVVLREEEEGIYSFAWDGFSEDDRRLAAGVYVLVMEAEGETAKQQFVRLN